jgi:hypothetical protein
VWIYLTLIVLFLLIIGLGTWLAYRNSNRGSNPGGSTDGPRV